MKIATRRHIIPLPHNATWGNTQNYEHCSQKGCRVYIENVASTADIQSHDQHTSLSEAEHNDTPQPHAGSRFVFSLPLTKARQWTAHVHPCWIWWYRPRPWRGKSHQYINEDPCFPETPTTPLHGVPLTILLVKWCLQVINIRSFIVLLLRRTQTDKF